MKQNTQARSWLARFLDAILTEGIKPQSRQRVHLSDNITTAQTVGARHGKPAILRIRAGLMHARGQTFYQADNGVWLTATVAVEFLDTTGR